MNKKLNNKGALDKNEINTMNNKIQMYEILNNFTSNNIEVPSVVQDRTNWKKSVAESLANKVDAYISSNKSAEDLEAYLQEISPEIERKATADYCANQYLNTEMKDIVKEYGYSYADDSTLQGMIDNYISQLSANSGEIPSDEEINETVINIINEYLSTAGLKDSDGFDLSQYGYTANDNSPLNDLQKSIIKSKMQNSLKDITKESDYETYKSLYDDAVNQFIESKLADGKFADFATLQNYGMTEFENSDNYKSVKKAIEVKSYMNSDEFKQALSSQISSSLADVIFKGTSSERPEVYNTIVTDAMEKAKNGEFDNADGSLNEEKFKSFIINNIKSNLSDFYKDGFSDMSIDDLGTLYDKLAEVAWANDSADDIKSAAISYCQAISKKSTTLAQAVKDVFGAGYAAAINGMKSYEIDSKMTTLKAKVAEIGDVSTMSDYEKNSILSGIKSSYEFALNDVQTLQLPRSATSNGKTVVTDRIQYQASGCLSVDNSTGKLTIDTSKAGTYSGTVAVYIDGEMVSSKTVTVNIKDYNSNDPATLVKNVKDWSPAPNTNEITVMTKANGNNVGTKISSNNFTDLYNNDNIIVLYWRKDKDSSNWSSSGEKNVKASLNALGTSVVSTLIAANPNLDKTKLQNATNTVIKKYAVNPEGDYYHKKRSGDTPANCYNYMTENKDKVKNGLVQTKDPDGDDSNVYAIYFKEFVDAIIAEYNKLVA